jgi:amidase
MPVESGLAMSWEEWGRHDAVALATRVRRKQVTARELARQVARAVELLNPRLAAVLEVFEDVVRKPDTDRPNKDGALYGVPMFLKDLGSGLRGRRQTRAAGCSRATSSRRPTPRSRTISGPAWSQSAARRRPSSE